MGAQAGLCRGTGGFLAVGRPFEGEGVMKETPPAFGNPPWIVGLCPAANCGRDVGRLGCDGMGLPRGDCAEGLMVVGFAAGLLGAGEGF